MANKEQVALLRQGVAAWNAWRDENTDIRPDFMNAVLGLANLSGANLSGASLFRARLPDADLSEAGLVGADLNGADLSGADLSRAVLMGADLTWRTSAGRISGGRTLAVPSWSGRTLLALISLAVTCTAYPRGV